MAWFPDLSPFTYSAFARPGTVNVGWLEPAGFPTSETPEVFRARLTELCREHPVNRTCGFHRCPFCLPGSVPACGSAELHLAASDGRVYAAPSLVAHYVNTHGYRPPDPFIECVRVGSAVDPVPSDPEELLAGWMLHQGRRNLAREPLRAAERLQRILDRFPASTAATTARVLLAALRIRVGDKAEPGAAPDPAV